MSKRDIKIFWSFIICVYKLCLQLQRNEIWFSCHWLLTVIHLIYYRSLALHLLWGASLYLLIWSWFYTRVWIFCGILFRVDVYDFWWDVRSLLWYDLRFRRFLFFYKNFVKLNGDFFLQFISLFIHVWRMRISWLVWIQIKAEFPLL